MSGINGVASNLAGKILSINDKGQLVDQYGNVISQTTYETLPEGYKYVLTDDGIIQPVFIGDSDDTSEYVYADEETDAQTRRLVIIISCVVCGLLIIALIVTLILTKKKGKTKDEKTKARRAKEKAKKAKLEAKAARKSK